MTPLRASAAVGPAADFPPNTLRPVRAAGKTLLIINVGGKLRALVNTCPHQGLPLCLAPLGETIPLSAGSDHTAGPQLTCPWHFWRFDVCSGESVVDPALRIESVGVWEEAGMVYVEWGLEAQGG